MLLAQADAFRRDLDEFIIFDELECLFERHADRRRELDVFVLAGGTDIRQLLGAQRVDGQVVVLGVDADELAFVDLDAFADQQASALMQADEPVPGAPMPLKSSAVLALSVCLDDRAVMVEHTEQQAGAGGNGAEFSLEADQAAPESGIRGARGPPSAPCS